MELRYQLKSEIRIIKAANDCCNKNKYFKEAIQALSYQIKYEIGNFSEANIYFNQNKAAKSNSTPRYSCKLSYVSWQGMNENDVHVFTYESNHKAIVFV